jgi:hypothetical protein
MQQKYYRIDYGHFKLPALMGQWRYVPKVTKPSKNNKNQMIDKAKCQSNQYKCKKETDI